MSTIEESLPRLAFVPRPSFDEVETFARLILQHEGRPASALEDCRREAELQLWAERSLSARAARRGRRWSPR